MRWTRQRQAREVFAGRLSVSEHEPRKTNGASCVRQNRVVPTPVAGAKLSVANSIRPDRSAIKPAATVTRRIRRRGEHGISRKAIAQGMPECSGCTCMLVCALPRAHCTRDRGCSKHPAFPAPSAFLEGQGFSKTRALSTPRECGGVSLKADRKILFVVPDKRSAIRDPYAAADVVLARRSTAFARQCTSVAMGPCVRRDDAWLVACATARNEFLAITSPASPPACPAAPAGALSQIPAAPSRFRKCASPSARSKGRSAARSPR